MFNPELLRLTRMHREGSYNTQRSRKAHVKLIARHLAEAGFKRLKADNLKPKHVMALVERWKQDRISPGTFKNRMGALRWMYARVGKHFLIPRENAALGIPDRQYVTNESKARELTPAFGDIDRIKSAHVRMSLELQRAFGLRREEALKIRPAWADRETKLVLQGSWTKGGRPREIRILTRHQREVLDRAKAVAGTGSMIPTEKTYINHLRTYKRQIAAAGFHKLHGLRHAYAQDRYRELTGREAPAAGGRSWSDLTPQEKLEDGQARMTISEELGHGREQITAVYLGR